MHNVRSPMRMPELLVFVRVFICGLVGTEIFRLTYYLGLCATPLFAELDWKAAVTVATISLLVCLIYAFRRGAFTDLSRVVRSARIDLFFFLILGIWSNELMSPLIVKIHKAVLIASPLWAPTILGALLLVFASPLWRTLIRVKTSEHQLYFLTDDEIKSEDDDALGVDDQAKAFADTVIASEAHSSLVFGIDGPWGIGKTSFLNLAEQHWQDTARQSIIVFRFDLLRYAADADLPDRLIRDLSATIQQRVFAPEFQPAATRYARMLKGKADFSFLGFKFSLEPTSDTIDELLDDIDDVLKQARMRVIIVIDDLDRLETKAINNVLFTVRRTFRLSQATYILCYDTENLAEGKEDGQKAREFLEKFINVKFSLFVDNTTLRDFLLTDWSHESIRIKSVPADTMIKLSSIISELADILSGDEAAKYVSLIGDLRKLKRFVNTVILMHLEKTELGRTDFNRRDLVNLILLNLLYPGLFRRIYVEETEGRSGIYSLKRQFDGHQTSFRNSEAFRPMLDDEPRAARFLLEQLFDENIVAASSDRDDGKALNSRACFNEEPHRNLEKYLRLIVRFVAPEPRETFVLYQDAVTRLKRLETSIADLLMDQEFNLKDSSETHARFWEMLVSQSFDLTQSTAEDAINTLVEYLPRYPSVSGDDRSLRQLSIYSLILLLDRAGWGRTSSTRRQNTTENVAEIADRIFGENAYRDRGLVDRLVSEERGVLGWNDLMLFRLQCSADRGGQVFNIERGLVYHTDPTAPTSGQVTVLAITGMRKLSQRVFKLFKKVYIEPRRNYFSAVDETPDDVFWGEGNPGVKDESGPRCNEDRLLATRSSVKSFVIYQLSNRSLPTGSGVGCGLYDELGAKDSAEISKLMNAYVFDVCFNPQIDDRNVYHFADHCLRNLRIGFWAGTSEETYIANVDNFAGGLDPEQLRIYWRLHGPDIKKRDFAALNKRVVTINYTVTYSEYLPKIFAALDSFSDS